LDFSLRSDLGTYALILKSVTNALIQVGRWGELRLQPGYYIYIGSAFGPGGVRARVSRHLQTDKRNHWHIDYLRDHVTPLQTWVSYEAKHLEHEWAGILFEIPGMTPIQNFGCSDCKCYSHLFHILTKPNNGWFDRDEVLPTIAENLGNTQRIEL
jgi:Uri superfamily endonuclease